MALDFLNSLDLRNWKKMAADHRAIAAKWPAYDRAMVSVEDYWFKLGPWRIGFCLEIWALPMWVGSASIQEQIGYETVELEGKGKIEVPQDALLSITSWTPEHFEQARFVLGETFGPLLRPGDDHQQALEYRGLFTLQHRIKYEGDMPWKRHMN